MIQLKKIKYKEWEGSPQEWNLSEISLGKINLIVGKNASGKSRTLNIINGLSRFITGSIKPPLSGNFDVEFNWNGKVIKYDFQFKEEEVIKEVFTLDGDLKLDRGEGGEGFIFAEEIQDGNLIKFQSPTSELAAVSRRDSIQHKFLEPLFDWGSSLRYYPFGTPLGKEHFAILVKDTSITVDEKDPNLVVGLYRTAVKEFGKSFEDTLISDMESVGYSLSYLDIGPPITIRFGNAPGELVGLYVQEKDLPGITDQNSMSQGMFRVLSLLIHINYSQLAHESSCIVIDDIGEGLDFERSCRLIDLLRTKALKSNTQLIMATNDKFVMNQVPLEEWSILKRQRNNIKVLNIENSKELFTEFKFTGLSNFSILELDFIDGIQLSNNS